MFGYSKYLGLLALVLYLTTGIAALNTTNTSNQSLVDVEPEEVQRAGLFKIQEVLNNDKIYNTINRPYDKNLPWTIRNQPTVISPRIDILRIGDITMDNVFSVDLYFVQRWLEPRLQSLLPGNLTSIRIRGRLLLQKLWLPDTIIRNSQESQHPDDFPQDNDDVVVLHRNGTIDFISRIRAISFCEVNLKHYPFDSQGCKVQFESLNYEVNELVYKPEDPIFARMAPNSIHPSKFELKADRLSHCDQTTLKYYGGESFSSFCIQICFKRHPTSVIIRSHVPAGLIVLSSFLGFFICPSQVPGRVTLAITCFLAMVTLGLTLRTPEGQDDSVVTAVDVYQIICITLVFFTLIEFAIVHSVHNNFKHIYRRNCCEREESNKGGTLDEKIRFLNDGNEVEQTTDHQKEETATQSTRTHSAECANKKREAGSPVDPSKQGTASGKCSKIDWRSFWWFFSIFLLFNLLYWSIYIPVSDDQGC
jgi:hypothetical protein